MGKTKLTFLSVLIILFSFLTLTGCSDESYQDYNSYVSDCIDINSVSERELTKIIHIGEVRAKDLVNKRPFSSLDDMKRIDGIAEGRLRDIKEEGLGCVK